MADLPRREEIQVAALERLRTITIENGALFEPRRVIRRRDYLDVVHELPILILLPAYDLDTEAVITHDGALEAFLGLEVTIFAQATDTTEAVTQLEVLEADVVAVLLDPGTLPAPRLGLPYVLDVEPPSGREGDEWSSQERGFRAWRSVRFRVRYLDVTA